MIDFIRPLADKKKQQLSLHLARELPRFRSDSGKLKQILYNLLSNALKFTPMDGSISLAAEHAADSRIRLVVSDTGPGIPRDQHEAIFEKFRQLDASKTREYEGTGLGLAITRDLVQILGGTISVDSQSGEGARFVVELPPRMEQPIEPAHSPSGVRASG
jgi:signal transduction histidine kinase